VGETHWKSYEEVAAYLLNKFADEFGLSRVEGKQSVPGKRSGTRWTIDAKGVRLGNEAFVIVECRRHTTTRQDQEQLGGLAYRIIDTGAEGGILVSPLGLQAGAKKVAEAESIMHVELHEGSTPLEFSMQFLNKIFVGIHEVCHASDEVHGEHVRSCEKCRREFSVQQNESICPACSADA
jgi:hypothetical protein